MFVIQNIKTKPSTDDASGTQRKRNAHSMFGFIVRFRSGEREMKRRERGSESCNRQIASSALHAMHKTTQNVFTFRWERGYLVLCCVVHRTGLVVSVYTKYSLNEVQYKIHMHTSSDCTVTTISLFFFLTSEREREKSDWIKRINLSMQKQSFTTRLAD